MLAILWAVSGVGFIIVAALVWIRDRRARPALISVAAVSLGLCFVSLWAALVGLVINLILLVVAWLLPNLFGNGQRGHLTT